MRPPVPDGAGYSSLTRRPDSLGTFTIARPLTGPEHSTPAARTAACSRHRPVSRAADQAVRQPCGHGSLSVIARVPAGRPASAERTPNMLAAGSGLSYDNVAGYDGLMDDHQPAIDEPHYHVWREHGLVFIAQPRRYRTRQAARQAAIRSGLEAGAFMVRPCSLPCRFTVKRKRRRRKPRRCRHCGRST